MTLISALLGIAADRLLTHLHEYRRYDSFLRYVDWVRARLSGPTWDSLGGLLLLLLPVWLVVGLLQVWVHDWLFGLIGLLYYVAVFVYCLGPRDLSADVGTWCEVSESSDSELRQRAAGRLLRGEPMPEQPYDCARGVQAAVLLEAADRMFAVLFWFALLGPLGAVMYRSVSILYYRRTQGESFADSVAALFAVLLWVPARLTALGFALGGHFDSALEGWREAQREQPQGAAGSERILVLTGSAALGDEKALDDVTAPVKAAMRLVWRSLTVWLVVLSLLVLAGWAG